MDGTGPGGPRPTPATAPLAGLRVVDVGTRISAPFCAGLLGDMGAEVIKVEDPRGGDFMRTIGPFVPTDDDGPGLLDVVGGGGPRAARGVTLDLRQPAGQELFRRLAATADVVCENFRPGAMEAWGIGPDDCDPRLVWARISVFGQDGPYSGRTGLDRMGIAYGGLLHLTGYPDRPPVRPGVSVSDYLTGTFAASAVNAALYRRDGPGGTGRRRGGRRPAVRLGPPDPRVDRGRPGPPGHSPAQREGNRMATSAPLDNYPTADGTYVCIVAGSNANFRRLCAAMGDPELADDPEWRRWPSGRPAPTRSTTWWRRGRRSHTAAEVEAALHRPRGAGGDRLQRRRHPGRPPLRRPWRPGDGGRPGGRAPPPAGALPPAGRAAAVAPRPAPRLGEHNDEVWRQVVGLTDDELAPPAPTA